MFLTEFGGNRSKHDGARAKKTHIDRKTEEKEIKKKQNQIGDLHVRSPSGNKNKRHIGKYVSFVILY